jgi:phytoene desaturase (3,4-didehydrolycopene-forming)
VDLVTTYNRLLPITSTQAKRYAKYLSNLKQTASTFSFYWGLDRKIEGLEAHNIFLADDYKGSFDQIFHEGQLPETPSFYIHVPTRVDSTGAPKGCDALAVLVPVSCILTKEELASSNKHTQNWESMKLRARQAVLNTLRQRVKGCESGIESWIVTEEINTPQTWESKFNLWQGSALGLSHNVLQVVYMRPSTRHADYGNLFFVGASTHPGTGVPIVLCGAKIVAEQIGRLVKKGPGKDGLKRNKYLGGLLGDEGMVVLVLMVLLSLGVVGLAVGLKSYLDGKFGVAF